MKNSYIFLSLLLLSSTSIAQTLDQTIKGQVIDKASQVTLPGATVFIEGSDPIIGAITDVDGNFRLNNVPIGRYNLTIRYLGYQTVTIPEVIINSGKEKFILVELVEQINVFEGVVVSAELNKDKPSNSMASISSRSFSVEETRRYAGGLDDPARLAASFAGVTTTHMGDNSIIIRGNAPKGVLWRLEGVEIPNPSHFSGQSIQGGGFTTIFSSQVLTNSDFYTGAFPAEYGNAIAGVFDMKLRNGNMDRREYTFQAGLLGFDFAAEGPFVKGKRASYLFNYRYSTFSLLANLFPDEELPEYQDLSFKMNFPTVKAGVFSVWGVGGYDNISKSALNDSLDWEFKEDREEQSLKMFPGATGINHKIILNDKTLLTTSLATTFYNQKFDSKWNGNDLVLRDSELIKIKNQKYILSSSLNHKFNAQHTNRTGFNYSHILYDVQLSQSPDFITPLQELIKDSGSSGLLQAFTQSRISFNNKFTVNTGIHTQYFLLNDNYSIEPRISLQYDVNQNSTISMGYGRHSQIEDIRIYLLKVNGTFGSNQPNKDLNFSKADHLVLGYDYQISNTMRLKIEPYTQFLSDIPVIADSSFSMINFKQNWFFNEALVNNGVGRNTGIDFTLERFLDNNYYWMITGSLYESTYNGDDGVKRNSAYNRNYAVNALYGKEFFIKKGNGLQNVLGINTKISILGGEYQTEYLAKESREMQEIQYDYTRPFEKKDPMSLFVDLTITYSKNKPNYTGTWALQVKNVTQSASKYEYAYSYKEDKVVETFLTSLVPNLSYKIEF